MLKTADQLKRGLIVSVQAPVGSPMRDSNVIAAMAEASLLNGAVGVRLESPEHIGAVRRRCPEALIIGLWKCTYPESDVYITPGWREVESVWSSGADVIAMDATSRPRPDGQDLRLLVERCRKELPAPLMADVDTVSNAVAAADLGFDWVGTTLYGYTKETDGEKPPALSLLPDFRDALRPEVRLICEGGIDSSAAARSALEAGADNVVVGTAITGVDLQVSAYSRLMAD